MNVIKDEEKWLSASEVAKKLGISRMRVNQLINNNSLNAEKIGTVYAIKESEVEEFSKKERKVGRPSKS